MNYDCDELESQLSHVRAEIYDLESQIANLYADYYNYGFSSDIIEIRALSQDLLAKRDLEYELEDSLKACQDFHDVQEIPFDDPDASEDCGWGCSDQVDMYDSEDYPSIL